MTVAVKNNNKAPLVVPPAVRRKARFKTGQELEFRVSGGVITILPKLPNADDEYTPEQRRIIDARLKEALQEVKAGHIAGPFDTAEEMIASLKRELKKSPAKKAKPRPREG
jgi:bifunctional DNA-binding transcriptional regulator/antitoxin component of YhaV-PrlF toxin-antitoxin module